MWIVTSNVSSVPVGRSSERNKLHACFSLTKGLRSKPQGTQLWRLPWYSLCGVRGNIKLETPAVLCATWMFLTLTERRGARTCLVVVIWTRTNWQLAEHTCCNKRCERGKHARGENTRGEKREEMNPPSSLFSRVCHQSRAACYPALRVLSSQLSVSAKSIHVAQKSAGVSRFKLRRIANLIWSTI